MNNDEFAGAALTGLLANGAADVLHGCSEATYEAHLDGIAQMAWDIAAAMQKEGNRRAKLRPRPAPTMVPGPGVYR